MSMKILQKSLPNPESSELKELDIPLWILIFIFNVNQKIVSRTNISKSKYFYLIYSFNNHGEGEKMIKVLGRSGVHKTITILRLYFEQPLPGWLLGFANAFRTHPAFLATTLDKYIIPVYLRNIFIFQRLSEFLNRKDLLNSLCQ